MTTGNVVDLDNGHDGYCVEVIPGLTYCGESYSPSSVERETYAIERSEDHAHNLLCFRCSQSDSRALRAAARGEEA